MILATKIGLVGLYLLIGYIIAIVSIKIVKKAIKEGKVKGEHITDEKTITWVVVLLWPVVLFISLVKTIFNE